MIMKTSAIKWAIDNDFPATYRNATPFVSSGPLWDFCMRTIDDPITMSNIVFANDLEIPPVKSLLLLYQRAMSPATNFQFTGQESQFMGALMGFVFKHVLSYQGQKERCAVNQYGVKTATRFLQGPVVTFEA